MKSRCGKKTLVVVDSPLLEQQKMFKVMKERIRRARISKSLEELKMLILGESSSIFRLDQADILEFTVKHLRRLRGGKEAKQRRQSSQGRQAGRPIKQISSSEKELENKENTENNVLTVSNPSTKSTEGDSENIVFKASNPCSKYTEEHSETTVFRASNPFNKSPNAPLISGKKKDNAAMLTALKIYIPQFAHPSAPHAAKTMPQASLLVSLYRERLEAKYADPQTKLERKPLQDISCFLPANNAAIADSTLWRPWK